MSESTESDLAFKLASVNVDAEPSEDHQQSAEEQSNETTTTTAAAAATTTTPTATDETAHTDETQVDDADKSSIATPTVDNEATSNAVTPSATANVASGSAASSGQSGQSASSVPSKIEILLKAVGNAPILKKKKFALERTKSVQWIMEWLTKYMKLDTSKEQLFLYVNQEFAPSPDVDIGTLYDCFKINNTVVFHYCTTPAWG